MRIILLAQTIIILASAYYIYTLHTKQSNAPEVIEEIPLPYPLPAERSTPTSPPTTATSSSTSITDIVGPNDQGMEWPTIDSELEVR